MTRVYFELILLVLGTCKKLFKHIAVFHRGKNVNYFYELLMIYKKNA